MRIRRRAIAADDVYAVTRPVSAPTDHAPLTTQPTSMSNSPGESARPSSAGTPGHVSAYIALFPAEPVDEVQ